MSKPLTPKSLGLADDVVLSTRFNNTRTCFKTVTESVLGYYVAGGGGKGFTRIAPIYRADLWVVNGKTRHVLTSHEIGDYLNLERDHDEEPDLDGNALAFIAASALAALENHAAAESLRRRAKPQAPKSKARKKALR